MAVVALRQAASPSRPGVPSTFPTHSPRPSRLHTRRTRWAIASSRLGHVNRSIPSCRQGRPSARFNSLNTVRLSGPRRRHPACGWRRPWRVLAPACARSSRRSAPRACRRRRTCGPARCVRWPMRNARSVAWFSTAGFHQRSKWKTCVRRGQVQPGAARLQRRAGTTARRRPAAWKRSTMRRGRLRGRRRAGTAPRVPKRRARCALEQRRPSRRTG